MTPTETKIFYFVLGGITMFFASIAILAMMPVA